jgi:predicted nuclease with TOPRIM domain
MREQLTQRLGELKAEYETGPKMLAELEAKQANLQQTLLRISGAIQVLEEILSTESPVMTNEAAPLEPTEISGNGRVKAAANPG